MEIKEIKKFFEELELVDSDEELGNTYFAKSKEDAYNCLDTMLPGEVTGIYLKHKEYPETQELTIEKLEGDKYLVSLEEDKPEYIDDPEGEGVMSDEGTKEDIIWLLDSLFTDYYVITNKNESIKESLQDEFKEAWDLIIEGMSSLVFDSSYDKLEKKKDKLLKIKSDKIKMKRARDLLFDIQERLIDEQYDEYNAKVDAFLFKKNESIKDEKEYLIVVGSKSFISNKLRNAGFIDLDIENYTGKSRKYDGVLISADDLASVEMFLQENGLKYYTPEELNESLEGYKTIAKILQSKKGFNVAEENDPMLTEDQPTLKSLLNNLAKYL